MIADRFDIVMRRSLAIELWHDIGCAQGYFFTPMAFFLWAWGIGEVVGCLFLVVGVAREMEAAKSCRGLQDFRTSSYWRSRRLALCLGHQFQHDAGGGLQPSYHAHGRRFLGPAQSALWRWAGRCRTPSPSRPSY